MAFFEKFRADARRYADGVHELGDPASERALGEAEARLGRALPGGLADFYRSWNGARLFADSIAIEPLERVAVEGEWLRIGESLGVPLHADERGRVLEADDAGDRVVVGSSVESWLAAVMAREALLVDRQGEWRDVFVGEGELVPEVARKRARAAVKADPDAAAWHLEQAELAFDDGDDEAARAALERATACDAGAGGAWELLGALDRRAGRLDEAERAFVAAAESTRDPGRAAERFAEAARAAAEAGRPAAREAHAARSLAAAPARAAAWHEEAARLASAGDLDGALNRATLAEAVAPNDALAQLVKQLRARKSLRVVD
jgi:tetratricopeptide (TPR) repeat protein